MDAWREYRFRSGGWGISPMDDIGGFEEILTFSANLI